VQEALNAAEETETITVDDFPGFVSDNTRVDGAPTEKTAWETDDVIYIKVDGAEKYATLTYNANESKWVASDDLSIKSGQSYEATYAPNYELNEGQTELVLKDGAVASTGEYLTCTGKRPIRIKFSRQYSRLRIYCGTQDATDATDATATATPITVTFGTGFTTNDASSSTTFSLSPDKDGNAYVYGSWKEGTKLDISSITSGSTDDLIYYTGSSSNTTKSASKDNTAYAMTIPEASDKWAVYNLDKATESKTDWSDAVNAGYTKIKVIGAWDSGKAPCFQRDYSDNNTQSNAYITSLDFGDVTGLTDMPDNICNAAYFLEKVVLPETVETIGKSAFSGCSNLRTINLPNTLKEIKAYGLYYCILEDVTSLPESLETIGDNAFSFSNIYFSALPESVKNIGTSVFYLSSFRTTSFEWTKSVTKIPDKTFYNSYDLKLIIPSSVTEIGASAFEGCYGLTIKCMATSVPTLGSNAIKTGYAASLSVPSSSLSDYQNAWGSYFSSISAIE
jgi:hypothetical protein